MSRSMISRWGLALLLAACGGDDGGSSDKAIPGDSDADTDADADSDTDADADADSDADTDTDTDPTDVPVFDDVRDIFEDHCTPCHIDNLLPSGGFSADEAADMVGVVDPDTSLAYVAPGQLDASYLWHKLHDTQATVGGDGTLMPPTGALGAAELARIEAWILAGAWAVAPGGTADTGDTRPVDSGLWHHDNPLCDPVAALCTAGCPDAPVAVDHAPWHNRLSASPPITWDAVAGATHYEVSLGTAPGLDDVACWTDVGDVTEHTFGAVYVLVDGATYYANVRAFQPDGTVSDAAVSPGWTVDIQPPEVPTALVDDRAPVDGFVQWSHPQTDVGAGFLGFQVAIGTSPYGDDAMPWTDSGAALDAVIGDDVALPDPLDPLGWYWVSVRATDEAGNRSQPTTSAGFITCPDDYVFVPGDDALGATPFCLARYEMRAEGLDGYAGFDAGVLPESRPDGAPWSTVTTGEARVLCDSLGFSYQLVTNRQWQAVARSIERTASNWSGGSVGSGLVNRGHCDRDPEVALGSDGDGCVGTNNPSCEDPGHADWHQKRTHTLHNGELLWDLAGNLQERVDGSAGAPAGLWMDFDSSAFTVDPGWEDYREAFAPAGDYTYVHGMGRVYGGGGNLTRGGSYAPSNPGSGGSKGHEDVGVFTTHHNSWNNTGSDGFRCVFVPM